MSRLTSSCRVAVLLVIAIGAGACSRAPAQITELRLPQDGFPGVVKVDDKSVVQVTAADDATAVRDRGVMQGLASQKITGTGYWRYWVGDDSARGIYKVRTTLFEDAAASAAAWDRRYAPQALEGSEPLALGDTGFFYKNQVAGFRSGVMIVEIAAEGQAPQLREFIQTYARFVAGRTG